MDLNSRQYVVSLDMTRTGSIRESFEMRHNDDNELIIELRDSAGIIDLNASGVINATLLVTRKDKVDIPLAGTITPEGRASFKLKRASLEKQGMVEVVAQFYFANDVRISTPTLIFNVLRDPSAGAVGDEGDDRTLIEIILNDAPALLEQLQTAYDELVIQKAAFADFQQESETAFSNAQNQRTTDFNADQAARDTAFGVEQTARQTDYTNWKDQKTDELNQLASDTENVKLAAETATADANASTTAANTAATNANNKVTELNTYDTRLMNAETEITNARQSTVKGKTFTTLDGRLEELDNDTYFPAKNEVANADFSNGTTGYVATNSTLSANSNMLTITGNGNSLAAVAYHNTSKPWTANKKVYVRLRFRVIDAGATLVTAKIGGSTGGTTQHTNTINNPVQNQWYEVEAIEGVGNKTGNIQLWFQHNYSDATTANGKRMEIDKLFVLDLETTFGVGNEPTVEEMKRILTFYPESRFDGTVNLAENKKMLKFLLNEIRANKTALGLKADKAQEAWITPTLQSGYMAESPVAYYKDQFGVVRLKGKVKTGTLNGVTNPIFTLPVGYRIGTPYAVMPAGHNGSGTIAIGVHTGGQFYLASGTYTTWIVLDGITFKAEA